MLAPSMTPAFLASLATPAVTGLGYVASESHHAHVFASVLATRHPLLEVTYDRSWWNDTRTRKLRNRADVWMPASGTDAPQCFAEAKLALLYDRSTRRLGAPQYGLQRAAPDWANDIYRLLIGPSGSTRCAFLLCVYAADGTDLLLGAARRTQGPGGSPLGLEEVDADNVYQEVADLAATASSADAISELANIVQTRLRGAVSHLGGPQRFGGVAADPLLFEWEQTDHQRSAWSA